MFSLKNLMLCQVHTNEYWLEYWEYVGGFNDIRPIFYSGTPFICEFEPAEEVEIIYNVP